MCIYIHPCLFLRKQREVTGVVYRRGLSALFVLGGGHCEGLEHGTDEGKIPTLFYIFLSSYIYPFTRWESGGHS
jgi:hypothetical protein